MPTPIQILNEMNRAYLRKKYPDIPPELLYCKPIKANSANELTKAVIKFIRLTGGQAERISVTGRTINIRKTYTDILGHRKTIGSIKYIPSAMTKGSADISATIQGKSIKIEIKWDHDRQSPAQAKYQAEIEKAGGIYLIVHTFDQFYYWHIANLKQLIGIIGRCQGAFMKRVIIPPQVFGLGRIKTKRIMYIC